MQEKDLKAIRELEGSYEYYTIERDDPIDHQKLVQQFSDTFGQKPRPVLYASLIREEYAEWYEAYIDYEPESEIKELTDLLYVIFGYANSRGWNMIEAFKRVHANNIGRGLQPDGTIKRSSSGKIIKNPDYPKVNLRDLL